MSILLTSHGSSLLKYTWWVFQDQGLKKGKKDQGLSRHTFTATSSRIRLSFLARLFVCLFGFVCVLFLAHTQWHGDSQGLLLVLS